MYPYQPHSTHNDESAIRGVLPEQRPPLDAALLDEPTSEVPVLRSPDSPSWSGDAAYGTETPEDPERLGHDATGHSDSAASPEPAPETADADAAVAAHDQDEAAASEIDGEDDQEATAPVATIETESEVQTLTEPVAQEATDQEPAETTGVVDQEAAGVTDREATAPAERRPGEVTETPIALWSDEAAEQLREQWRELQVQFIDDPAEAVAGAKELVTASVQQLADTLQSAQDALDPYLGGEPVDTETMRVAMRRYREFLDRVLAL